GWHDELIDERANGRQVQIRVVIDVEAAERGHKDAAAKTELRSRLPFEKRLLDLDLVAGKLIFKFRVEKDVVLLRQHGGDAEHEARVDERRRAAAIHFFINAGAAKLRVAIAADGDAVCTQDIASAIKVAAM